MWSEIFYYLLMPLVYLTLIPGATLLLACVITFFTLRVVKNKLKLWMCTLYLLVYGVYDIGVYLYSAEYTMRLELIFFGSFFYFSLIQWILIYRESKSKNST